MPSPPLSQPDPTAGDTTPARGEGAAGAERTVRLRGERLTVGRSNVNDVVLDDVNVSRFHAEIVDTGGGIELRDLDSRCGTRLDGQPVRTAILRDGSQIGIGSHRLVSDGSSFAARDERGALRLAARGLEVRADGRTILDRVSLDVEPGELVAIIGASGSGKSTLLRLLAGVDRPTQGGVTLNGEPVTARLTDIGYVPQDEIVHPLLEAGEALDYAARLRLPDDTEDRAIKATVRRVVGELSLERREGTRIADLSGGERRRIGVGSELVNRPSILFLDEPTTGLDPELEAQTMRLFRGLADPRERAVVLVTHATQSLTLCDRLLVMGEGGRLTFSGSPQSALTFFGVETLDQIYPALRRTPATELRSRFEAMRREGATPALANDGQAPAPGPAGSPRAKLSGLRQAGILTSRSLRLLVRDGRNLLILLGQVPLIGLAIALMFESGLFTRPGTDFAGTVGSPDQVIQLLFLMATTVLWFGSVDGSREIVKERSVRAREKAVGIRLWAYVASKLAVLLGLSAVQSAGLAFFVFAIRPLGEAPGVYAAVVGLLIVTGFVGVAIGLLVSALVRSEDQATSLIPLTLIPQLLFAGAIVPVVQMTGVVAAISLVVPARWALAGLGSVTEVQERLGERPGIAKVAGYGDDFFAIAPGHATLALLLFLGLLLAATVALLAGRRTGR